MASLGRSANVSNMEAKRAGRRLSGKTVPAATRAAQSVCVCIEHPLLGIKVCCQRLLSYYLLSASWAVPTSSQKLWVMLRPSGGRQGCQLGLRIVQTFFQSRGLLGGMHGGTHDQHPFAPFHVAVWRPTGPRHLIALGGKHLVPSVIGAPYPF